MLVEKLLVDWLACERISLQGSTRFLARRHLRPRDLHSMLTDYPTDTLIPWAVVRTLVGIGRTTAWRLRRTGLFPSPRQIGTRQFWLKSEIARWQTSLPVLGAG